MNKKMFFNENGFEVIRNFLSKDLLEYLSISFEMEKKVDFIKNRIDEESNKFYFGDGQSKKSYSKYCSTTFEPLLVKANNIMNSTVGKDLIPTYSYARIYYNESTLKKHIDRPSCEYSSTICINTTDPWDFFINSLNGDENKITLFPGDMCVYMGNELEHWREQYDGEKNTQCFLHYVDSNGKFKDHKYDKKISLGLPFIEERSKYLIVSYS